jgi:hypothetical protein
MNRTTAVILTIVSALLCGLPGLGLFCLSALGSIGINTPGFYEQHPGSTPQEGWLGIGIFIFLGVVLLIIPTLVGIFSFKMSKSPKPDINEPLPPAI